MGGAPLSFDSNNRIVGWSYDASGNLLNDGVNSYTYDAEGHIKTVNSTTAYVYDGSGARVRKLVGENTRFVYGLGGELIMEFDGSNGNLKKEYISSGITIEPTAVNSNGTRYGTADNLGSPRAITNSLGSVVSRHDYMPFGEELGASVGGRTTGMGFSVADGNRKKFTGYEADSETGLNFAQARYQSSTQGRFTSPDPFGGSMSSASPQSFNRYAYVGNNPLTHTDSTGLSGDGPGGSLPGAEGALGRLTGQNGVFSTESWKAAPTASSEPEAAPLVATDDELFAGLEEILAGAPQNLGTILVIVGDSGLGEHNQGRNFERVAETKNQELTAAGYNVVVTRASGVSDFNRALTSNGILAGVEYVGHAGSNALFVGEQPGAGTNIDRSNVSQLSNAMLSPNAYIKINGCFTGYGGWQQSIAGAIANQLGRTTFAFNGPTIFSGSERARTAGRFAPSSGPLYLIEDRGTRLVPYRPYRP